MKKIILVILISLTVPALSSTFPTIFEPGTRGERDQVLDKIYSYLAAAMTQALYDLQDNPKPENKEKFQKTYRDFYKVQSFLIGTRITDPYYQQEALKAWHSFYDRQASQYSLDPNLLDSAASPASMIVYAKANDQFGDYRGGKSDERVLEKFLLEVEESLESQLLKTAEDRRTYIERHP